MAAGSEGWSIRVISAPRSRDFDFRWRDRRSFGLTRLYTCHFVISRRCSWSIFVSESTDAQKCTATSSSGNVTRKRAFRSCGVAIIGGALVVILFCVRSTCLLYNNKKNCGSD
jgi:hypothetical protein